MSPLSYADWRHVLRDVSLPAAVIDLAAFDRNVDRIATIVRQGGGKTTLRVATKSLRVPDLIGRVLDHGPPYRGLMCYSAREARFLHRLGFDDLLLAYPTHQRSDLDALREIHDAGGVVRAVVDSVHGIRAFAGVMRGAPRPFPLIAELDVSLRYASGRVHLGVRRSGLRSAEDVRQLFRDARSIDGVELCGVMGYEAQVAGLGDANPFRKLTNPIARSIRNRSVRSVSRIRRAVADALSADGFEMKLFNGGGTGSLTFSIDEPWLTEVTAGSGFLCSHLFDYYSNVRFEPAAFFALQCVRSSDPEFVTCQSGGYIASGQPGWDKVPRPHLPEGLALVGSEGCGEVQTPLRLSGGRTLAPGDPVLFRHAKAGELAEHFEHYSLVDGGGICGVARTYRGHGQCFG